MRMIHNFGKVLDLIRTAMKYLYSSGLATKGQSTVIVEDEIIEDEIPENLKLLRQRRGQFFRLKKRQSHRPSRGNIKWDFEGYFGSE